MLNVLVTGAAGLIGGEVCAQLVARGHRVSAMVRRSRAVRGSDRAAVPVARLLPGDVTRPRMGLEPDPSIDIVIHCAAALEFDAPEAELNAVNVAGTRSALAYAEACGAAFLHVSTAYVCGLEEGAIAEAAVPPGRRFANRYEASKAAGEAAVMGSALPWAIARPSIVLGHSRSGAISAFPSLCNVFRLMARGRVTRFPAAPAATLDLVPIDHVARGLVAIADRMEAANGGIFHLVADTPTPAAELAHGVARIAHFPDPQVVDPQGFDPASLSPLEQRVLERMLATFGSYFRRDPRFDDSAFRELTGLACPPTDRAWLDRLIAYGIAAGYLPPAPSEYRDSAAPASRARQAPTACRS